MADNVYFNITIPHDPINPLAIYSEQLNQSFLKNPEDYYATIVRFSIPGQAIPLFIPEIQAYPNTNVNNTVYSVTLQYGTTVSSQTFVQYISPNPTASQGMPLTPTHPFVDATDYYELYVYSQFIEMINNTLATAFTQLSTLTALPAGSAAPYLIFDQQFSRISLIAQAANYGRSTAPPSGNPLTPGYPYDQFNGKIMVWFNTQLGTLLSGIPFKFNGYNTNFGNYLSSRGQILLADIVNQNDTNYYNDPIITPVPSPPTYLQMVEQYSSLANWNCLKSIILTTSLLPVNKEFVPNRNTGSSNLATFPVMADFIPLIQFGPEARTTIDYVSSGEWRLIDMSGVGDLSKIDLSVYWLDNFGRIQPLEIDYGQQASIKILFQKKSLTKK